MSEHPVRVLVVTDHADAPNLLDAIRRRAGEGPVQFRVLIPNPAHAEAHLRHPEHHAKAEQAERVLHDFLPAITEAAGGPVLGSVSIRNDPYDAVEETLLDEPVDEFMVALARHGLAAALHLDLPHRLAHFGLPVTTIPST
ncbi:MAG: hypothetical protein QOJ79_2064 [Actinomycetota bacterium]|nr:hypothetical protein [Actinomycetota bacterium]